MNNIRFCIFLVLIIFGAVAHAQKSPDGARNLMTPTNANFNKCVKIDWSGGVKMQNICEEKIIVRYCYVDGLWNRGDVDKTCNNEGIRSTGEINPGETVEAWSGVKQPRNSAESSPLIMVACRGVNASTRCWSDGFDGYDLSPSGEIFGNKSYIHPREKTKVRSISGDKCFFPGFSISEGVYVGRCKDGIPSFPGTLYYESSMNGKPNRNLLIFAEDRYIGWKMEVGGKGYYTLNSEGKIPVWAANILLNRGSKDLLDRQEVRQAIDIVHAGFSRNPKDEESVQKLIDSSFPLTAATTLPLKTAKLSEKSSAEAPRTDTSKVVNDEQGPVDPGNLGIEFSYKVVNDSTTWIYGRGGACSHLGYNIVKATPNSINERNRGRVFTIEVVKMMGGTEYYFPLQANTDYSGFIREAQKGVAGSRGLPDEKIYQDNLDIAKCVSSSHQQYLEAVYAFHEKNWKKCPGACRPSKLREMQMSFPFSN